MEGLLLVDKPKSISSFGVVARVRGIIKASIGQKLKVGHSGTLDPSATGLLIVAIGPYTKRLPELIKQDKTYLVEMTLGKTSTSGDSEGDIKQISSVKPALKEIKESLLKFTGKLQQTPPIYSAMKINGVRAYKLARQGKEVKLMPRQTTIYHNKLIKYQYPIVVFESKVSSGTYIRSLVEDIGEFLQTGAYTSALRRSSIGEYNVSSAIELKNLSYQKILNNLLTLEK